MFKAILEAIAGLIIIFLAVAAWVYIDFLYRVVSYEEPPKVETSNADK